MSYARFGGRHWKGGWFGRLEPCEVSIGGTRLKDGTKVLACYACRLRPDGNGWWMWFTTSSRREMLRHLKLHRRRRHRVPKSVSSRLLREIKREGDRF